MVILILHPLPTKVISHTVKNWMMTNKRDVQTKELMSIFSYCSLSYPPQTNDTPPTMTKKVGCQYNYIGTIRTKEGKSWLNTI